MSRDDISVHFLPEFRRCLSRRWLRSVVEQTLEREGLQDPVEVGVVIADDEKVQELNKDYRGLDETTDVLAFAFQTFSDPATLAEPNENPTDGFIEPPQQTLNLGEVVVSYPQAKRQAAARGGRIAEEAALLVAHGVLHLLGYDHAEPLEERVMWQKQDAVVAALFPKGHQ
jgi:probable rRNA maturation factor